MNSMYFKSINQYTTEPFSITNDFKKTTLKKNQNTLMLKKRCWNMQDETHKYIIKIINNLFIDINIVISYTEIKNFTMKGK